MIGMTADCYLVDDETGEVLGHNDIKPDFIVDDIDKAEWVMEKFSRVEGDLAGVKMRRDALVANLDYEIKQLEQRKTYLQGRFTNDLLVFAQAKIEGMKQKFVQTAFGRLSFRTTPGSTEILDKDLALEWAVANCPDAVQTTYKVVVTPLKGRTDLPANIFQVNAPGEAFTIKTGVKDAPAKEVI